MEPFSKQCFREINVFKVWFNDASNGANNRAEEQQQGETLVRCFEQRYEKKLKWIIGDSKTLFFFCTLFNVSLIIGNCGGRQVSYSKRL